MVCPYLLLVFMNDRTEACVFHRFFIISLIAMVAMGAQQYEFSAAAANLTLKLRSMSFRSILKQDSTSIF